MVKTHSVSFNARAQGFSGTDDLGCYDAVVRKRRFEVLRIQKHSVNYSVLSSVRISCGIQMVDGGENRGRTENPPNSLHTRLVK